MSYKAENKTNFYGNVLKKWMSQPQNIRNDPEVKNMLILSKAMNISNYVKFIQILKTLPLLIKMILWRILPCILLRFIKQLFLTSNNGLKINLRTMFKIGIKRFNIIIKDYKIDLIFP